MVVFMAQSPSNLLGEFIVQPVDDIPYVKLNVADVQILAPAITGIQNVHEVGQDIHNRFAARKRRVAEVVDSTALGIGGDQSFSNFRQGFFQANVGGHETPPGSGKADASG